jgi:hypothetical protein
MAIPGTTRRARCPRVQNRPAAADNFAMPRWRAAIECRWRSSDRLSYDMRDFCLSVHHPTTLDRRYMESYDS